MHTTGEVRPCCMIDDLGVKYKGGLSIRESLNAAPIKQLRSALLRGEKPSACASCYEEDRLGIFSVRLYSPAVPAGTTEDSELPLKRAELSLTNACNLDCVMCRPVLSTKVARTQKEFHTERGTPEMAQTVKPFTIGEEDAESLVEQFKDADEFRLIGGEPLMTPVGRKLIKLWADRGNPGYLDVVTNGTFVDEEILEDLSRCKQAVLNVSVDAAGGVYEWIRGHSWSEIAKTLIRANEKVNVKLTPTVQVYNLMNLIELSDFCAEHKIRLRMGHILRHPYHLSALLWPRTERLAFIEAFAGKWGEDKEELFGFLAQDKELGPGMCEDFREWTRFMNRKRGFTWESFEPRARVIM